MEYSLALLGLAVALFASTNIDDIFVLVGFFADPTFRVRDIVIGQYGGIAILFGVSVSASLLAFVIPHAFIGLLGIAPIVIGAKNLFKLYQSGDKRVARLESHTKSGLSLRSATVTIVTIANGADNIGVYVPSFAIRSSREIAEIGLVFAVMTALWCFIAHSMVNHPKLGRPIRRYGHRVAPIALIGLGILILYQADSLRLLLNFRGQ